MASRMRWSMNQAVFLGDSDGTVDFVGANPVLGVCDHPDCREPLAFPHLASGDEADLGGPAAGKAAGQHGPPGWIALGRSQSGPPVCYAEDYGHAEAIEFAISGLQIIKAQRAAEFLP